MLWFMIDLELLMDLEVLFMYFNSRVFGQEEVVEWIVGIFLMVKIVLVCIGKLIVFMLFVGFIGVGKIELAKQFVEFMFGMVDWMICFDMSEFVMFYFV